MVQLRMMMIPCDGHDDVMVVVLYVVTLVPPPQQAKAKQKVEGHRCTRCLAQCEPATCGGVSPREDLSSPHLCAVGGVHPEVSIKFGDDGAKVHRVDPRSTQDSRESSRHQWYH
ncbi:unnamed protein product [Linum trigynum]|uniref:Uncharacterized protein n=1 Tax=Linum trigynum TaxID=586398 RepID=A0AAV2FMH2_9ROSI